MSKIEDAINSYVESSIDTKIDDMDWVEMVKDNVDFAEIVSREVDFGDLARDALIENVSTALDEAIPGALRDFDFKELIKEQVDFAELLQQNIDWHEAAKDAVETEMTRQFHDLERAIDDKVIKSTGSLEEIVESLRGEITMLQLEVAKLKNKSWLRRLFGL